MHSYIVGRMRRYALTLLLCVICIAVGGGVGWFFHTSSPTLYKGGVLFESSQSFDFVDPLLACDIGTEAAFPEFVPLKQTLTSLIGQKVTAADASQVSIYVRSLKS